MHTRWTTAVNFGQAVRAFFTDELREDLPLSQLLSSRFEIINMWFINWHCKKSPQSKDWEPSPLHPTGGCQNLGSAPDVKQPKQITNINRYNNVWLCSITWKHVLEKYTSAISKIHDCTHAQYIHNTTRTHTGSCYPWLFSTFTQVSQWSPKTSWENLEDCWRSIFTHKITFLMPNHRGNQ